MTGKVAPATFAGLAPSVAVIEIVRGAIVLTGGAETVAAMFPDASATVLPTGPPPIDTGAPAVNLKPVTETGAPETKQAPWTEMPEASAAAGAASAAATARTAAERTFMFCDLPVRERLQWAGRGRGRRLHTHGSTERTQPANAASRGRSRRDHIRPRRAGRGPIPSRP